MDEEKFLNTKETEIKVQLELIFSAIRRIIGFTEQGRQIMLRVCTASPPEANEGKRTEPQNLTQALTYLADESNYAAKQIQELISIMDKTF